MCESTASCRLYCQPLHRQNTNRSFMALLDRYTQLQRKEPQSSCPTRPSLKWRSLRCIMIIGFLISQL
uniref:Uncharacterized protein n=1 Tax=Arundo donax TaxID=35708 RepID=A0A0A8Z0L1_ARUDO